MILVTAAHGNQGKLLVPKLLAAGQPVRACVQSHASAEHLRALGVREVVVGDISEPKVLASAIRGTEKIYHVGPTAHPRERAMGFAVVDAAKAAGVRHLVFSSVLHAITTDLVQHEIKRDIEEHVLSSGLEFTILQPANYMLPLKLRPVFEKSVFELSWSLERRQSLVDLGDVTDVGNCLRSASGEQSPQSSTRLPARGSIVLTSGTIGVRPTPGAALAASGAGAIEGLTRGLAVELAPIRVNAVRPGVIRTPMWDRIPEPQRETLFTTLAERTLTKTIGEADQIAATHLFLMENRFVTGTVLTVDGGLVLTGN